MHNRTVKGLCCGDFHSQRGYFLFVLEKLLRADLELVNSELQVVVLELELIDLPDLDVELRLSAGELSLQLVNLLPEHGFQLIELEPELRLELLLLLQ